MLALLGQSAIASNLNQLARHAESGSLLLDEATVPNVNRTGDCDVVLNVEVGHGISPDHASSINFVLSDHERAKANVGTDFGFFDTYVKELRTRSQGVAPKL